MTDITLPAGDYAIVEMFGHTTLVGRMSETERFGVKMLALEPVFRGKLLPAMMIGGASIYALTPCSAEVAQSKGAKSEWHLPDSLRSVIPPEMLPAPVFAPAFLDEGANEVEEHAEAEDAARFDQPKVVKHHEGCECLDSTMLF